MPETAMLVAWLVKATALLMLAMGITMALRRAPAGARYVVWLATLVAILLVPAVASWSPFTLRILPALSPDLTTPLAGPLPSVDVVAPAAAPIPSSPQTTPSSSTPSVTAAERGTISLGTAAFAFWGCVAALLLTWLLLGALTVRRIVRRGRVLADESWLSPMYDVADRLDLDHAPRLVMSDAIEMPFACGILRPTIVLPTSAAEWSTERRRVVLFHELAHVRRRDLLGHTIGRVVCAVYWFHPLVWSAAKQLRAESERACDDLVLACGGARASDYANHLLEIVTSVRMQGAPATALPMANKREFEGRMLAILDPAITRATPSRVQTATLATGLAALALSIAAVSPARRLPPQQDGPPIATKTDVRSDTAMAANPVRAQAPQRAANPMAAATTEQTTVVNSVNQSVNTVSSSVTNTVTRIAAAAAELGISKADSVLGALVGRSGMLRFDSETAQQIDTALLGKVLRTDKDVGVRKAATWVLHGHRDGVPLLLERLRTDAADEVREMAAWALVGTASADAVTALSEALKRDKSEDVRATAAWGLGQFHSRADTNALVAALGDESSDVRERALWALGHLDFVAAPPKVVSLLADPHAEVRLMAAWVLGNILDKSTIPAIRTAFLAEHDLETLQAEFRALLFMGDRSQQVIDRAMNHEDPEIRARAVRMIAGQGPGSWPWPWPWPDPRPEP